ncbi:PH domain-containing protein [Kibdelosporangium lantanae]|uniref:PH domain-containing protein n=1 Tax=Kibdelosporangium lantanae TaxID=1497396 RepID=A0ABW3MAS2_9PSEU
MAYPDDLLSEGERVVIHKHPHWKMLLWPYIVLILTLGLGIWLAILAQDLSWNMVAWIAIAVVALALIVWLFFIPFLRWRTTHFIVTTDRVMAREGVVNRTGLDIPLSRINSVRFEHGLIDRIFGCGTLIIESASDEPLDFDDIPQVEKVHSLLYREINDNPNDDFNAPPQNYQQQPPPPGYQGR